MVHIMVLQYNYLYLGGHSVSSDVRYRIGGKFRGVANDPEISYTFHEIRQEIHRNI